jgi:hypothetical protein
VLARHQPDISADGRAGFAGQCFRFHQHAKHFTHMQRIYCAAAVAAPSACAASKMSTRSCVKPAATSFKPPALTNRPLCRYPGPIRRGCPRLRGAFKLFGLLGSRESLLVLTLQHVHCLSGIDHLAGDGHLAAAVARLGSI